MESRWYYQTQDRTHGPVSFEQVRRAAATGAVAPHDAVWSDSHPQRTPAANVPGLFDRESSNVAAEAITTLDELQFATGASPSRERAAFVVAESVSLETLDSLDDLEFVETAPDSGTSIAPPLEAVAADELPDLDDFSDPSGAASSSAPDANDGDLPDVEDVARGFDVADDASPAAAPDENLPAYEREDLDQFGLELVDRTRTTERSGPLAGAEELTASPEDLEELLRSGATAAGSGRASRGDAAIAGGRPVDSRRGPRVIGGPAGMGPVAVMRGSTPIAVRAGVDWYCRRGGFIDGPVTLRDLRMRLAEGSLALEDEVRHGPQGQWKSAGDLLPQTVAPQFFSPQTPFVVDAPSVATSAGAATTDWSGVPATYPVAYAAPQASGYGAATVAGQVSDVAAESALPASPSYVVPNAGGQAATVSADATPPAVASHGETVAAESSASSTPSRSARRRAAAAATSAATETPAPPEPKSPEPPPPEPELPSAFDQSQTAGVEWCCWIDGVEYGPLAGDQLLQWVSEGRVLAEDPVRRADSTEWFPANSLGGLFEQAAELAARPATEESDAATAAADSAETATTETTRPPADAKEQAAASVSSAALRERLGLDPNATASRSAGSGSLLADLKQQIDERPFLYAAVVLLGLITAWVYWPQSRGRDREDYDTVVELWTEFKTFRQKKPSDAEWTAFHDDVKTRLRPLVKRLEKTASAREAARQQLLYSVRDYYPKMFEDSRKEPGPSETQLSNAVSSAGKLIFKRQ